jgi:hypothetical protein
MATFNLQGVLLEKILADLPMNNLVATLVPLLKQTRGNVYKKLRLEVPFTADEIAAIARHYNISIDDLLGLEKAETHVEKAIEVMQVVNSFDTMTSYLDQALGQLQTFRQMPGFSMTYVARDLPLFHYFAFPELGALKALTWVHENLQETPKLKDVPRELLDAGAKIWAFYKTTPSVEIWSPQTLSNTLQNIIYYWQCDVLSKTLSLQMLVQLRALLQMQKETILHAKRLDITQKKLVYSPFIMMSNGALMRIDKTRFGMLAVSSIQTLILHHPMLLNSIETSVHWHMRHGTVLHEADDATLAGIFSHYESQISGAEKLLKKQKPPRKNAGA